MFIEQHEGAVILTLSVGLLLVLVGTVVLLAQTSRLNKKIATLENSLQWLVRTQDARQLKESKLNSLMANRTNSTNRGGIPKSNNLDDGSSLESHYNLFFKPPDRRP